MKFLKNISAFIFDLDGVITNTSEFHYLAWKRMAEEEGIPFSREDGDKLRGISRREALEIILSEKEYSIEKINCLLVKKNHYYLTYIESLTEANILPGILNLMQEITDCGFKLALGSASKNARKVLNLLKLDDKFDVIVDGYSVTNPKPSPDIFLFAAEQLGSKPGECVVIEDAAAGITAANRGGFISIGIGPLWESLNANISFLTFDGINLKDIINNIDKIGHTK